MNDGWHKIYNHYVYVENNYVVGGLKGIEGVYQTYGHVFRALKSGWGKEEAVSVAAFRAGVKRGTITIA